MDVLFGVVQRIGQRGTLLIAAGVGALLAALPALWMWGFTVDDALVSVRYARHLATGAGWRMNANGPSTDGVTPLPWPLILAPFARAEALVVFARAKAMGLAAWALAGACLGASVWRQARVPAWARAAALVTTATSVPVAAHAVSGMETAIAMSLATLAALCVHRPIAAAVLAGAASSLRPEMAPWACVLAVGLALAERSRTSRVFACGALALAPFVLCALVRLVVWGRPAPLALMAKPGDVTQGLAYAGAALVVTLTPILALAPLALRRAPHALAIVVAAIAHVLSIVAVGGDWMPYARLMVPIVPSLAWAAVLASEHAHPLATAPRSLVAVAIGVVLVVRGGTGGRRVGADQAALIDRARLSLSSAHRVAALDIGWVSAATGADVVDLAGITDPEIAALPGGHTSKRVDAMLLLARDPDVILLYTPIYRVVEARLAADEAIARRFTTEAWLPLGENGGYMLLRRRDR